MYIIAGIKTNNPFAQSNIRLDRNGTCKLSFDGIVNNIYPTINGKHIFMINGYSTDK